MVRIAAYINDEKIAGRVKSLLHAWAQEIGVDLQLVLEKGVLSALNAEGCALFLVDSAGLDRKDIRCLQMMHAKHPDCGLVLLADDDRTAIDVYPCHPNALVPKPVTYSGLDAAMERCFGYWQKGLRWLDLPAQHRRVRIPLYQLYYAEAAGRSSILYRAGGGLQVNCSLSVLEAQLPQPPFLRVQKSFVVHLGAIRRISGGELIMCNDRVISVARSKLRQVQEALASYRRARSTEEG